MKRILAVVFVCAALTGCASFGEHDEDGFTRVRDTYAVDALADTWGRQDRRNYQIWSVDGPLLQALWFFDPVAEDEAMLGGFNSDKLPKFRPGLSALDAEEFIIDTLATLGLTQVQSSGLRPVRVSGLDGFAFDLSYLNENGLAYEGHVRGAEYEEQLHVLLYTGTRAYYFDAQKADVERMLDSVKIVSAVSNET